MFDHTIAALVNFVFKYYRPQTFESECVYIFKFLSPQACAKPLGQVVNRCLKPFASINTHSHPFPVGWMQSHMFPQSKCVALSVYSTHTTLQTHPKPARLFTHTCCRDSCGNICIIKCLLKIIAADFQDII